MLDKCNFTAHAWCEHNVTTFGITRKKLRWKKGSEKCFGFLDVLSVLFLLSFPFQNSRINAEYLKKVRMVCGFCQACSKLVESVGCSKGRTRSSSAWCCHPYSPTGRPGVPLKICLWPLQVVLGATGLDLPSRTYWQAMGSFCAASPAILAAQVWPTFAL